MANSFKANCERGSELVEFSFAIMILLALVFGVVAFAQAAYAYHFVSHAAREATRYASVRGSTCNLLPSDCPITDAEIQSYVERLAPLGINTSKLTVTPAPVNPGGTCTAGGYTPGCAVQVQVQYAFTFLSMLHAATPTFTISSTSQMVISQ